ncbi:chromate transporter [Roseateles sp. DAIF2]|uniref:chromate transporter n=1 Tax=Roseateles sp. DAIF2 TaxID=2714952 RepID=UPI0018C09C8B|nr:chromate transporter [Roseateles sp. DAIF2]QPF73753.1 chromate transporter [Roseateles sp. DAIF2]
MSEAGVPLAGDGQRARPASLSVLFWAFNRLALQGFGGVLAVAQRELVERLGWLTREEFLEMLAIGQVLPGPNIVNLSLMIGDRFFGLRGALTALAGMLAVPCVIVLGLASLSGALLEHERMAGALRGMGAVAAGLILATGLKLLPSLKSNPVGRAWALLLALAAFGAIALARLPLIWVVLGLGGAGMALAVWHLRRAGAGS